MALALALSVAGGLGCMTTFEGRKVRGEIADLRARLQARPRADRGREIAALARAVEDAKVRWATADDGAAVAARVDRELSAVEADAERLADTIRRQSQVDAEAAGRLGGRLAALERSDAEIADKIGLLLPDDKEELWRQANSLLASGEHGRGRRYYQAFIDRFPEDPRAAQAYLAIGRSYLDEARYSNAAATLQRLLSLYPAAPEAPQAMWQLSRAFEQLSFCSDARSLLHALVGRYPKSREAAEATTQLQGRPPARRWPCQS